MRLDVNNLNFSYADKTIIRNLSFSVPDGAFISIGRKPSSELFEGILAMDEAGYIIADESTRTNIPGVFAIGDVRTKALRQVVTAVADGATASHYIEEYLAHQM